MRKVRLKCSTGADVCTGTVDGAPTFIAWRGGLYVYQDTGVDGIGIYVYAKVYTLTQFDDE